MLTSTKTYAKYGPKHQKNGAVSAADCTESVCVIGNKIGSAKHVFPGLNLALSAIHATQPGYARRRRAV